MNTIPSIASGMCVELYEFAAAQVSFESLPFQAILIDSVFPKLTS